MSMKGTAMRVRKLIPAAGVVLALNTLPSASVADIVVSINDVPEPPPPWLHVWICDWVVIDSTGGATELTFHVADPRGIPDLHIGTWDDDDFVVPADPGTPGSPLDFFDEWQNACTGADVLGGPDVPGVDPQPWWQTLDLWNGPGLEECHYYTIEISKIPELQGVAQNVWIHFTPEPGTLLLLGLGGLTLTRRRKK